MPSEQLMAVVEAIQAEDRKRGHSRAPQERPSKEQHSQLIEHMNSNYVPIPANVATRTGTLGEVPGVWFEPEGADRNRVILYFHGGGYMFGSAINTGHVSARLAAATGCLAFSVDYRLSIQAPFPAAVDDAVCAFHDLLDEGYESGNIVLAGDSAGGGLIVSLMLALRDAGVPLPAAGLATSPWTDLAVTGASIAECEASDVNCSERGLKVMAEAYLDGADPCTPLASPLYADLFGLPPLLVQVGGAEQLRDDGVRLAERAKTAGVDVTLDIVEGAVHIWQYIAPDAPEAARSEWQAGAFLKEKMDQSVAAM